MKKGSGDFCEFDSRELLLSLDLTFPAGVDAVSPVVDRILALARQMSCIKGKEFEVEASLQEALANAVVHGCKRDPDKQVQVSVACDRNRGMLIVVRDPGPGFDVASIPSPVTGENIFSSHGRGIFLINQLMDRVSISRQERGTEIRMLKR